MQDGRQQQEATPRIRLSCYHLQCVAHLWVMGKAVRSLHEPLIELALGGAKVAGEVAMEAWGIIHQKAGMDLEKVRQQSAGTVRHVGTRTTFNLGQVRLAQRLARLRAKGADDLDLGHGAIQTAQRTFNFAKVADFVSDVHIAICNVYIAICEYMSRAFGEILFGYCVLAAAESHHGQALRVGLSEYGMKLTVR